MTSKNRVEAVEKALDILTAFAEDSDTLTLKDLAARTGLVKSTILRLTGSLEEYDFLTRDPEGRWRLGPALWRLGTAYRHSFDLAAVVMPTLRTLRDSLGESVAFYIRDGDRRICLHRMVGSKGLVHEVTEGVPLPLDKGAAGRVLLTWSDDLDTTLTAEQVELFNAVKADGYAASFGERDPDVAAVAVPVITGAGVLKGALSVSGLKGRFTQDTVNSCVAALKPRAEALGKAMP